MSDLLKLIHIVGRKNHGKTTLMVNLVQELTRRGVRVGTIKHSSHRHELDAPGKDSYLHRQAGGNPAAIISQDLLAAYLPRPAEMNPYHALAPLFTGCDLVLVEGDFDAPGPKLEVWRQAVGGWPLAAENSSIVAVVSDDPVEVETPVWPRSDVSELARRVLELA